MSEIQGRKPRILITNDDGIHSLGIRHLWKALAQIADITIVAPATEVSGAGLAVTMRTPLHIDPVDWEENTPAWKVNGTPADCVGFALSVILKEPPDLVVSGINRGVNSGRVVLYSGTVGGAIEAALHHIPGIAFSCVSYEDPHYAVAEPYVVSIVRHVLENSLPPGTILNVNFPNEIQGLRLACQGKSCWVPDPEERTHPEGNKYYWRSGKWTDHEEHEESDVALLRQGFATVVPIHVAELTDQHFFSQRKAAFESLVFS